MTFDIEEIKTISLKEGDMLAVRLPEEAESRDVTFMQQQMQLVFPNNKVLIYIGEIEFTKIEQENK